MSGIRPRTQVLYIAGTHRSGSTIIGNVLGEIDGFVSGGEINMVWYQVAEQGLCGCGRRIDECGYWQPILASAQMSGDVTTNLKMHRALLDEAPIRAWRLLWRPQSKLKRWVALPLVRQRGEQVAWLYDALQETTGCRWIVDGSKDPAYGYLLAQQPNVDLHVLHLIRDPRGTIFSEEQTRNTRMRLPRTLAIATGCVHWLLWNRLIARLWGGEPERYLRLRYETFAEEPVKALRAILAFVGDDPLNQPPLEEGGAVPGLDLGVHHTVAGNDNRLRQGRVAIMPDERWRTGFSRRIQWLILALTWPDMRRYRNGVDNHTSGVTP